MPDIWERIYNPADPNYNRKVRLTQIGLILLAILVCVLLVVVYANWPKGQTPVAAPTRDPAIDALVATNQVQATVQAQQAADITQQALSQAEQATDQAKRFDVIQTQLAQPTAQPVMPTAIFTTAEPMSTDAATAQPAPQSGQSGDWKVTWFPAADKVLSSGLSFKESTSTWVWRTLAPQLWPDFPNVPNPLVPDFRVVNGNQVPDGMEYAMNESNFCQQLAGEACRYPVGAGHFLFYSGDYSNVPQLGACKGTKGSGCEMAITNVGENSSDFTSVFQQGFRLHARFFNGDTLNMGLWALMSNGASNMLNLSSNLNPQGFTNGGANCSVRTGCTAVDARILIVSGNEPLLMLTTTATR